MFIFTVAILAALAGVGLSIFAQKVEANSIDSRSADEWSRFQRAMNGGRK